MPLTNKKTCIHSRNVMDRLFLIAIEQDLALFHQLSACRFLRQPLIHRKPIQALAWNFFLSNPICNQILFLAFNKPKSRIKLRDLPKPTIRTFSVKFPSMTQWSTIFPHSKLPNQFFFNEFVPRKPVKPPWNYTMLELTPSRCRCGRTQW